MKFTKMAEHLNTALSDDFDSDNYAFDDYDKENDSDEEAEEAFKDALEKEGTNSDTDLDDLDDKCENYECLDKNCKDGKCRYDFDDGGSDDDDDEVPDDFDYDSYENGALDKHFSKDDDSEDWYNESIEKINTALNTMKESKDKANIKKILNYIEK
jgi:hypothetical protein